MASADISVVLLRSLLDAVRNDDVERLKFLLSTNPEILDLAAKNWPENPLVAVCKLRSFRVVEEIRIRKPEFARLKDDGDCCNLLHCSCVRGDVDMVKVLVGLDSQLCFVHVSTLSMIPLHIAVIHGHLNVIRELLRARPESLETLTSLKESALHLAAKNHQNDTFAFLLKEVKPDQIHLLYGLDSEGSSALEIATVNNIYTEEGQLLLVNFDSENSHNLHEAVEREELGTESEDINGEQQTNFNSEICAIDITFDKQERFSNGIRGCNSQWWLSGKRKFMLIFPAILLGLSFSSTVILPYFFPREKSIPNDQVVFQFRDIVTILLPPVFYIMTLNTTVRTISSINLTMLLFSHPFGSLLFLCVISTFALYVLLTYCTMPRFFVRIDSQDVSSFPVMWTLALGLVFLVAAIYLVKYCFHKLILRMRNLSDLHFRFTAALSPEWFSNGIRGCNSRWWLLGKRKFMLIFLAILLGLGFSSTVIHPYFFPREKSTPNNEVVFLFRDIVTTILSLVYSFMLICCIMTLITVVLTAGSIDLTILLFSHPFRSFLFLCGITAVLLTYCTSYHDESYEVMRTLALWLVFLLPVLSLLVKFCYNIIRVKLIYIFSNSKYSAVKSIDFSKLCETQRQCASV